MKLSILQEKIKKGLSIVERVSSKSLSLPILNNVLLSAEKNFLNLTATDLEVGVNWWALAKVDEEGKITIPARLLSGFVNSLPNQQINIRTEDDTLFIDYGKYKTQVKGISADEFPIIPKIEGGEVISVNAASFCQSLDQVVDISIPSTTRPEISGVYLVFQKDTIVVVSTDSFRLGEKKIALKNDSTLKKEYSLIIPQRAIKEVINIFGEKEGDMKISFSSNQVMFEVSMQETDHPEIQLISRLIEGEYPNYQEIIPSKHTTQITLNRAEFLNQIKTASLFGGKTNEVKVKVDAKKGEVEVSSQSSDVGSHESIMSAQITGDDVEASFNHRFLADGLLNIKSSEVLFELNGDSGAGVLKPIGDNTYLYVVMPIKLT